MKRFWLVLLSLGLVLAFSASAMAVDVKFSGSFEAAGIYLDKTTLMKNQATDSDVSTAFYYQRLRLETDFIVSPGLKLVTRFNALERIWGGARSTVPLDTTQDSQNIGTRAENENIAFTLGYVEYLSPIGLFQVGYIHDNVWGTAFGDNDINGPAAGGILYGIRIEQLELAAIIYKEGDKSSSAVTSSSATDQDNDKYVLLGKYNFTKDTNAGLLYSYSRIATTKQTGTNLVIPSIPLYITGSSFGTMVYLNTLQPYVKAKFGPVRVEAEFWYAWGKIGFEDGVYGNDQKLENIMGYVNAMVDVGPAYFGGTFAYISGDNPTTTDKFEGGLVNGGADFNPCLIMFNQDLFYWAGAIRGYNGTQSPAYNGFTAPGQAGGMDNAWFGQGKVGVRPIAPLDINASLSYAQADKKPTGVLHDSYGWEIDVTGTYKITNNLSYMLGGAYWFVGDYFKGTDNNNATRDNFMVINKLTLTF
jgi:hypothetical protein